MSDIPEASTPERIKLVRKTVWLTQKESAAIVFLQPRISQYYEAGKRTMLPVIWELFLIKTGMKLHELSGIAVTSPKDQFNWLPNRYLNF